MNESKIDKLKSILRKSNLSKMDMIKIVLLTGILIMQFIQISAIEKARHNLAVILARHSLDVVRTRNGVARIEKQIEINTDPVGYFESNYLNSIPKKTFTP